MRPSPLILGACLALIATRGEAAIDRVSRAELDRAVALLRGDPATRILNARVTPSWIGEGPRFWYRREQRLGHAYVTVDASSGAKAPAFDHAALAGALAAATGERVDAATLTVVEIGTETLRAKVGAKAFTCTLAAPTCRPEPSADPTAVVSPDGRSAVFRRDDNLWLRDLATGAERALTTDGAPQFGYGMPSDRYDQDKLRREREGVVLPPIQTWWSPDSRHLVTARLDQRHLAPYPYLENAPRDGSFRPVMREVRLPLMGERPGRLDWWIIDVVSGARRPIDFPTGRMIAANNGIDDLKVSWSQDGRSFLAISAMTDYVGGEVFSVDLATGKSRVVLQDRTTPGNPLVAGGYGAPVARFIRGGRQVVWWSERDGWGHLYLYDVRSGRLINRITRGDWLVRDIVGVDEAAGVLWFTAVGRDGTNPYHRYLYRIGLDGRDLTLMTPEPGDHMIIDPTGSPLVFDGAGPTPVLSPRGDYYVYDVSSIDEPTRSIVRRARDGALIAEFDRADASGLFAAGYRPPEEVTIRTPDGQADLYGLVYRPSDHDPALRYPVLDIQYGNPAVARTPRTFNGAATYVGHVAPPAATAELGFIVVVVDARGTPYRSDAFSQPPRGYLATMGLEDHIAFIRGVAARDPSLDLTRVGIAGQSFGGYTTIRGMLEFPHVFKVGVAGAPQTAYHNMAAEAVLTASQGPPVYADGGALRPTPTDVPENFKPLDSAAQLDRLKGPLLIVAGEQDENVYPGTVMQFVDRAIAADRPVELIWMPNQAHTPLYTRYALWRSWEFLIRHLQERLLPDELPPTPPQAR